MEDSNEVEECEVVDRNASQQVEVKGFNALVDLACPDPSSISGEKCSEDDWRRNCGSSYDA